MPADVKSQLLGEVLRYNSGFPVERIFRHLSMKHCAARELSQTDTTGRNFVILYLQH